MKRKSIKWRIFKYNLIVIITLMTLVIVIFNAAVRIYIEKEIVGQLKLIATHTEEKALFHGPDFFPKPFDNGDNHNLLSPIHPPKHNDNNNKNDMFHYYFILDQSLRESLSVLNADYLLFDSKLNRLKPSQEDNSQPSENLVVKITKELSAVKDSTDERYYNFSIENSPYIAIIKPVSQKNTFGLGWIIIYSSLQKVNQLKLVINLMLVIILFISALIMIVFSSITAKKISNPLSILNSHIQELAERNFSSRMKIPVEDELRSLVNNINDMSEKLSDYDKAQKTFLQNASHELRTPLMSIQSYAEGIKYEVVEPIESANIILAETKRLTSLVEDLLYLSRLDAIQENYRFEQLDINEIISLCCDRMNGILLNKGIKMQTKLWTTELKIFCDEEKLSRAITNIISNCVRYAKSVVNIEITASLSGYARIVIADDGNGFEETELPMVFDRFYKGKNGNVGLGLAISQNIIEKHNGTITAQNSADGALFTILIPLTK